MITSFFGGAMLATVATASLAQAFVADNAALLATVVSSGYVVLGGNLTPTDYGSGILMPGPPGPAGTCQVDGGIVFGDGATPQHCFYRADPTYSVREWGALCDVAVVKSTGSLAATWTSGAPGTLSMPTALLPRVPAVGDSIAVSQIGSPTLWKTSTPAVSLTRFSQLGGTQVNYVPGDLISFMGTVGHPGTFSQQTAIIVDAVDSGGSISQWHFLFGGLYSASAHPTGAMVQDDTHGSCVRSGAAQPCGTGGVAYGATLTPAWSGWSVLNSQTIANHGSGYSVGDIVTLTGLGVVANQGHLPKLIVEATASGGGMRRRREARQRRRRTWPHPGRRGQHDIDRDPDQHFLDLPGRPSEPLRAARVDHYRQRQRPECLCGTMSARSMHCLASSQPEGYSS